MTSRFFILGGKDSGVFIGMLLLVFWFVVGMAGFVLIEGWTVLDALYMSVITISTVGYGEVEPLSPQGRLFAVFLIMSGLGTAVYTFTRLGQVLLEGELLGVLGRRRMRSEVLRLRNHFIVCGYGRMGSPVADGLERESRPFCVIEKNPDLEADLSDRGYLYLIGDANDEETLQAAGIESASCLLALLPSDADNLLLTLTAKELNRSITVIARASDEKVEPRLKRSGADKVFAPFSIAGSHVLHAAVKPTVLEVLDLVSDRQHLALSLEEIRLCEPSRLNGKSIADAQIRNRYGVVVVAVKKPDGDMLFNPDPDQVVAADDILVVLGEKPDLQKLEADCAG